MSSLPSTASSSHAAGVALLVQRHPSRARGLLREIAAIELRVAKETAAASTRSISSSSSAFPTSSPFSSSLAYDNARRTAALAMEAEAQAADARREGDENTPFTNEYSIFSTGVVRGEGVRERRREQAAGAAAEGGMDDTNNSERILRADGDESGYDGRPLRGSTSASLFVGAERAAGHPPATRAAWRFPGISGSTVVVGGTPPAVLEAREAVKQPAFLDRAYPLGVGGTSRVGVGYGGVRDLAIAAQHDDAERDRRRIEGMAERARRAIVR